MVGASEACYQSGQIFWKFPGTNPDKIQIEEFFETARYPPPRWKSFQSWYICLAKPLEIRKSITSRFWEEKKF